MRPVLMLFVGLRGQRVADMCQPLSTLADVVVATSEEVLARRGDTLADTDASHCVLARTRSETLAEALRFAARHHVDGALSFGEDCVEAVASFAAERDLPGQPVETLPRFCDKFVQRRTLEAAGVPTPLHALVREPGAAAAALAGVPLPAMLKPTRGSGSALTYVIDDLSQLEGSLQEAFASRRRAGGAVSESTDFLLEELLIGVRREDVEGFASYVSVESAAGRGRIAHLAVTDRFPVAPPALETGMMLPSGLPAGTQRQVVAAADQALRALEFTHGLAHTELMLTADGPRVIEVNARAGGALPYLFPLASDLDLVAEAGRLALGEDPCAPPRFRAHAVFVAPQHPVGVQVVDVRGLDEVAAMPEVHAVIPLALGGTSTEAFQRTMVAAVLAVVGDPAAAVRLYREVMGRTRTRYADGRPSAAVATPGGGPAAHQVAARSSPMPSTKVPTARLTPPT